MPGDRQPAGLDVLVTAGGSGIGRTIATMARGRGDRVHVADIDREALGSLAGADPAIGTTCCDVSDEAQVDGLFREVADRLGGLDVLVNCAGIAGPTAPVEEVALADWERCVAVNLGGTFLCTRRALPMMRARGGGSIVNLSSTAGIHGFPNRSPYAAAKWAVVGFTKTVAMEAGPFGIRANAICPGSVDGPRMDGVVAAHARLTGEAEAEVRARYESAVSLGAFVSARDVAEMALFLSSPAGAMVSGQALPVDGHTERM